MVAPRGAPLLCCPLGAALPAAAADGDGQYALHGAGRRRCADFLKAEQGRMRDRYLIGGWLDGYLSALNQRTPKTYDLAPWQDTEALTRLNKQGCARDPKQWFFAVVGALTHSLQSQRLERASKRVIASAGKRHLALYQAVLRRVQQRLVKLGHYAGTPDGAYGPGPARRSRPTRRPRAWR